MIGKKYTLRVSKKDNGVKIFNNYDENNWRVLNVHYQNYEDAVYLQIKLKPLVDLLNELYKENKGLKHHLSELQAENEILTKEKEKLKKENEAQKDTIEALTETISHFDMEEMI